MTTAIHPVDEILPAKKTLTPALQHVAVSYVGSVAVPLIIANALGFSAEETILLISATFFVQALRRCCKPSDSGVSASVFRS